MHPLSTQNEPFFKEILQTPLFNIHAFNPMSSQNFTSPFTIILS